MASDVLSTQGVRSSRDMVPTKFARNIPVSAAEEFNSSEVLKQEQFFSYTLKFCKHVHNNSDHQISCAKVRNPAVIKCHELRFETPLCVGGPGYSVVETLTVSYWCPGSWQCRPTKRHDDLFSVLTGYPWGMKLLSTITYQTQGSFLDNSR